MTDAELLEFAKTTPWPIEEWEPIRWRLNDIGMRETSEPPEWFEEYGISTLRALSDIAIANNVPLRAVAESHARGCAEIIEKSANALGS